MNRLLAAPLMALTLGLALPDTTEAARVRVVHRGHRTRVTVHRAFPLHRRLPHVYVRAPRLTVRAAPRVYLPPLAFGAVVVTAAPAAEAVVWTDAETLARDDGWTDFTLVADRRGRGLVLEVDRGKARLSFAEIVFENGDAQVVDFDDHVHDRGFYSLLDFEDGRTVDHVRVVAAAASDEAVIKLHLLT